MCGLEPPAPCIRGGSAGTFTTRAWSFWAPCRSRAECSFTDPGTPALVVYPACCWRSRTTACCFAETMTMATLTPARRDHLLLGAPLVAYAVIWFAILFAEAHSHWLLALCTTAAYVGGHVFEITRRGHWLLSADATAAPASLVVFALGLASCGTAALIRFCSWSTTFWPMARPSCWAMWWRMPVSLPWTTCCRRRQAKSDAGCAAPTRCAPQCASIPSCIGDGHAAARPAGTDQLA